MLINSSKKEETNNLRDLMTINFLVDYFRITIHAPTHDCIDLYHDHFEMILGELVDLQHGAKGFKGIKAGLFGFQLKHTPGGDRRYCTFEFPGQVCKAIPPEFFKLFLHDVKLSEYPYNVTRIDLAFDNVPFLPAQVKEAITNDVNRGEDNRPIVRSLTKRTTLRWDSKPLAQREDNSGFGQDTCYFGSRQSELFLRVYNKRGPTRLEIELKGNRATFVANDLLSARIDNWGEIAISHLRDFIDIDRSWWEKFVKDTDRAYVILYEAKEVSLDEKKNWLLTQVAPTLSAVAICTDGQFLLEMDEEGRNRMNKQHKSLLSAHGKSTKQ